MKNPNPTTTTLCLGLNVLLAIIIVLLNKWVYVQIGFPNVTMTFIHFAVTSLGLVICQKLSLFQSKVLPVIKVMPLATAFCGFVVLTNLSLGHNTVGTYQTIKTMTMPCIMYIQTYFYGRKFSWKIKFTLLPLTLGVVLNSCYDIKFNALGTTYASAGVVVTSLYQVWVGEKQKEFQVNSMQLLYYQAPLSMMILLLIIPFIEPPWVDGGLFQHAWTIKDLILLEIYLFIFMLDHSLVIWNCSLLGQSFYLLDYR
ncbi:solute carrier family 35 member E3-like isoform X4 [Centruroides sculpturatus]|nr:solute carrier family 35 member E3-like isoform X4 [Centruroides sculpturatus]